MDQLLELETRVPETGIDDTLGPIPYVARHQFVSGRQLIKTISIYFYRIATRYPFGDSNAGAGRGRVENILLLYRNNNIVRRRDSDQSTCGFNHVILLRAAEPIKNAARACWPENPSAKT